MSRLPHFREGPQDDEESFVRRHHFSREKWSGTIAEYITVQKINDERESLRNRLWDLARALARRNNTPVTRLVDTINHETQCADLAEDYVPARTDYTDMSLRTALVMELGSIPSVQRYSKETYARIARMRKTLSSLRKQRKYSSGN